VAAWRRPEVARSGSSKRGGGGGTEASPRPYRLATEESWLRAAPSVESPQRDYLSFVVGGEEYGVGIEHIREIIKVRAVTEVPHAPRFVLGVIAVRGTVVPVLCLRRRLKLAERPVDRASRFLVVHRGDGEPFGLLVDEVRNVVRIAEADIEPPPAMLSGAEADFVAGIGRVRGRMVILLSQEHVLRFEVRRRADERAGGREAGSEDPVEARR
jgi:purine-binding chemotaxis protein CheW